MSNIETKKSTVTRILHNTGEYQSQHGTMYKHEITFANGDRGHYSSKSDTCQKFEQGKEASYTIETKQHGQHTNVIIKPVQEQQFVPDTPKRSGGNGSMESFALSYSKDVSVAIIASGKSENTEQILNRAEVFYSWLKSK